MEEEAASLNSSLMWAGPLKSADSWEPPAVAELTPVELGLQLCVEKGTIWLEHQLLTTGKYPVHRS